MTPLAHQIALERLTPVSSRKISDLCGAAERLEQFLFFDVSAVWDAAFDIADAHSDQAWKNGKPNRVLVGELAFLPANKVWLETYGPDRSKFAVLLEKHPRANFCSVAYANNAYKRNSLLEISKKNFLMPLAGSLTDGRLAIADDLHGVVETAALAELTRALYVVLAMINTPRVIGRRQHMPHAGLQRKLAAAKGMVGKFPLQGWTELKLEVRPPKIEGEREETAYLTGGKALHFCRAHLRIRRGKLERVTAHWRGDPSLGIKRTRYTVVPPKPGTPWPQLGGP
jgi:hypothetical protein